ncbi:hypothetical protein [Marivita sp. S2033]|uniref:hypothetical protein n=1 Tax=Marivita sp. S2033 TaxID=3373187 RepID=UPI00398215B0
MRNLYLAQIVCFFLIVVGSAQAKTGAVLGGEHDGFTRLTVSTIDEISEFELKNGDSGILKLVIEPRLSDLDTTKMFDRLVGDRLLSFKLTEQFLELVLNCDCRTDIWRSTPRLLVIDIYDEDHDEQSNGINVSKMEELFLYDSLINRTPFDLPDHIKFDHSIARAISSNLSQTLSKHSTLQKFNGILGVEDDLNQVNLLSAGEHSTRNNADFACEVHEFLWDYIESSYSEDGRLVDKYIFKPNVEGVLEHLASYLSDGLVPEARSVLSSLLHEGLTEDQITSIETVISEFQAISVGDANKTCSPLSTLIWAAQEDLSNQEIARKNILDMLTVFQALPVGLKLHLYPKLKRILDQRPSSAMESIRDHHNNELSLVGGIMGPSDGRDDRNTVVDPDQLSAVAVATRGTEFASETWNAEHDSFMQSGRYFDAFLQLHDDKYLDELSKLNAFNKFFDRLVENADIVSVLEIGSAYISHYENVDPKIVEKILLRLMDEGFTEAARAFWNKLPGLAKNTDRLPKVATALDLSESSLVFSATESNKASETGDSQKDNNANFITVPTATGLVESAAQLREKLSTQLSEY